MANEAVILRTPTISVRYDCASDVAITKGALLALVDPFLVSGSNIGPGTSAFAGIAAADKVAADGATTITLHKNGKFDLVTNSVITAGDLVMLSGSNLITRALSVGNILSGCIIGKALETAAGSETIAVEVGVII